MLHMSASTSSPSTLASRKDVLMHSAASHLSDMSRSTRRSNRHSLLASAVLIVPLMDESHADLLMIPIADDSGSFHGPGQQSNHVHHRHRRSPSASTTSTAASRTETPAAPTPPPKPQLPEGCQDWDSYLSRKKSTAKLPLYESESARRKPAPIVSVVAIQSPELNFKHSFEQLGWRDCLNQTQRKKANATTAKALRRIPSAASTNTTNTFLLPLVYDATSPGNSSSGSSAASTRRLSATSTKTTATVPCYLPSTAYKRLSGASTLTTNTAATAPCYLTPNASKRLSGASTLTFASTSTMGKPRSLRRINRARHLRTYYSDGSLLRGTRRLSVGISSMQGIAERREPPPAAAAGGSSSTKQRANKAALMGELCAPPPFPPPEKPLPSLPRLPVVKEEVRELQTGERTRWRELLLRSFPRREASRRRAGTVAVW